MRWRARAARARARLRKGTGTNLRAATTGGAGHGGRRCGRQTTGGAGRAGRELRSRVWSHFGTQKPSSTASNGSSPIVGATAGRQWLRPLHQVAPTAPVEPLRLMLRSPLAEIPLPSAHEHAPAAAPAPLAFVAQQIDRKKEQAESIFNPPLDRSRTWVATLRSRSRRTRRI